MVSQSDIIKNVECEISYSSICMNDYILNDVSTYNRLTNHRIIILTSAYEKTLFYIPYNYTCSIHMLLHTQRMQQLHAVVIGPTKKAITPNVGYGEKLRNAIKSASYAQHACVCNLRRRYTTRFARTEPADCPVRGSIVTCDMSLECPGHLKIG